MGRYVIAAYRPKPGQEAALLAVVAEHPHVLRAQNLVTDRAPQVMRATDGTVIEVFEWVSAEASAQAHDNPVVQALWARFALACDHVPLSALSEVSGLFAEFMAIDLPQPSP